MFRRRPATVRGGRGVVGAVAQTASIAGTASATVNSVDRRSAQQANAQQAQVNAQQAETQRLVDMQDQLSSLQAQQAALAAPTAAGGDMFTRLQQLTEMKQAGMLTDEEFSAAKSRLLGT
jgi:TolA-binding protein